MSTITGIKKLSWAKFQQLPDNTRIFNYGWDECVAVVNEYVAGILGLPLPAGYSVALQWWTNHEGQPNSSKNFTKATKPVPGAIVVWKPNIYTPGQGHIGVVTGVNTDGTFTTLEQNYVPGGTRWTSRYTRHNDAGVYGFLIPKKNPAVPKRPKGVYVKRLKKTMNVRAKPTTVSALVATRRKGTPKRVTTWTRGQKVDGSDVWIRVNVRVRGKLVTGWIHSSGFVMKKTTLKRLKEAKWARTCGSRCSGSPSPSRHSSARSWAHG